QNKLFLKNQYTVEYVNCPVEISNIEGVITSAIFNEREFIFLLVFVKILSKFLVIFILERR
ncbi:TPA: hypothetical protein ACSLAC_002604, partial [Listeria innocua]